MAAVFRRLIGERACRPWIARTGIGDALIDPAVKRLGERLTCGRRLTGIEIHGRCAEALAFGEERLRLTPEDKVILALPPPAAAAILPNLVVPTEFRAIVNAHFRVSRQTPLPRLVGLTGGLAQWALWRDDVVSATVSAADHLLADAPETLAERFWPEMAMAFDLDEARPAGRVIKERRATIAATPAMERLRPPARTGLPNLLLAGDWVRTGLPGTLEGAVRSGTVAMRLALA
jgi:hypothetical protein